MQKKIEIRWFISVRHGTYVFTPKTKSGRATSIKISGPKYGCHCNRNAPISVSATNSSIPKKNANVTNAAKTKSGDQLNDDFIKNCNVHAIKSMQNAAGNLLFITLIFAYTHYTPYSKSLLEMHTKNIPTFSRMLGCLFSGKTLFHAP